MACTAALLLCRLLGKKVDESQLEAADSFGNVLSMLSHYYRFQEKGWGFLVHQNQLFELDFQNLWGRRLQLIDCQNLFCEVDKYSRVYPAHPFK